MSSLMTLTLRANFTHLKEGDKDVNMKFRSSPDVGMD